MSVFLGYTGNIRLRRSGASSTGGFEDRVRPDDVNVTLARLGLDRSLENLVTGDRVELNTTDPRGLICFAAANWSSGVVEDSISGYVHINAAGGLRFFNSFQAAVNNVRASEYTLTAFAGDPIPVTVSVKDTSTSVLGNVISYELNTSRESIDTTALSDKFKNQYSAGLISGSGRIECFFDYTTTGINEPSLLLLQTLQRVDIGSSCDLALFLLDKSLAPTEQSVYYEFQAVIVQSGITVDTDNAVTCSVEFLTTGEIQLRVGEPAGYILKEDDDRIKLEQSLDFLLQEAED